MTNVVAIRPEMETGPVPAVPGTLSFKEMADELLQAAHREASSLDALHFFALYDPSNVGLNTIAEVRRLCAAFYDMSNLLRTLAPHEEHIRQIAARAEAQA